MKPISSVLSWTNGAEHISDALFEELVKHAELAKEDMQTTTVWFDTVAPNFTVSILDRFTIEIGPEDTFGGQVWAWLDLGTLVRYATMTKDPPYFPTTIPDSLKTFPGHGELAFVDTSKPRPGIKPRNWTQFITRIRGEQLQRAWFKKLQRVNIISKAGIPRSGDFWKFNLSRQTGD